MSDDITLRVEWDVDPDDGDPPPAVVTVPFDVWRACQYPISTWLADKYGYLVKDWNRIHDIERPYKSRTAQYKEGGDNIE